MTYEVPKHPGVILVQGVIQVPTQAKVDRLAVWEFRTELVRPPPPSDDDDGLHFKLILMEI